MRARDTRSEKVAVAWAQQRRQELEAEGTQRLIKARQMRGVPREVAVVSVASCERHLPIVRAQPELSLGRRSVVLRGGTS